MFPFHPRKPDKESRFGFALFLNIRIPYKIELGRINPKYFYNKQLTTHDTPFISIFYTAEIEPDDANYDQYDTEYFDRRQRFFEVNNSDNGNQSGAEPGPEGRGRGRRRW